MRHFSRKKKLRHTAFPEAQQLYKETSPNNDRTESAQGKDPSQNKQTGANKGSDLKDGTAAHSSQSTTTATASAALPKSLNTSTSHLTDTAESQASLTLAGLEREYTQEDPDSRRSLEPAQPTPQDVRHLRELILTRYQLDLKIWNARSVHTVNRGFVLEWMRRADAVLRQIYSIADGWRKDEWDPEEWELVQAIKQRLHLDGKRLWENNPPWNATEQPPTEIAQKEDQEITNHTNVTYEKPDTKVGIATSDDRTLEQLTPEPEPVRATEELIPKGTTHSEDMSQLSPFGVGQQGSTLTDPSRTQEREGSSGQTTDRSMQLVSRTELDGTASNIRVSVQDIDPQALAHFYVSWQWAGSRADQILILDNVSASRLAELKAYTRALQELDTIQTSDVEDGIGSGKDQALPQRGNSKECENITVPDPEDTPPKLNVSNDREEEFHNDVNSRAGEKGTVPTNEELLRRISLNETLIEKLPDPMLLMPDITRLTQGPMQLPAANIVQAYGRREPTRLVHAISDPDDLVNNSNKFVDKTHGSAPTLTDIQESASDDWENIDIQVPEEWKDTQHLADDLEMADMTAKSLVTMISVMSAGELLSSLMVESCLKKAKVWSEKLDNHAKSEGMRLENELSDNLERTSGKLKAAIMKHHFAVLKAKEELVKVGGRDQESKSLQWNRARDQSRPQRKQDHHTQRVHWTCVCGTELFDDYVELVPGSLSKLQQRLEDENWSFSSSVWFGYWIDFVKEAFTSLASVKDTGSSGNRTSEPSSAVPVQQSAAFDTSNSTNDTDLDGWYRSQDSKSTSVSTVSRTPGGMHSSVLYLLLCFPVGLSGLKLHHAQILMKQLRNDRQLFQLLREAYSTAKENVTLSSRLSLRSVTRVSLSHFLVDLSHLVDLKPHSTVCAPLSPGCRCLPPAEIISPAPAAEYICDPAEPDYMPPFGVNYLTHYFQHPSHLNPTSGWVFRQVPKRMAGQLMAGPDTGFAKGWGLAFEEGWDRRRIGQRIFILVAFGALIFGLLYAVLKKDVQSAFSISGFVVSVLAIIGGYLGSGEARSFAHE